MEKRGMLTLKDKNVLSFFFLSFVKNVVSVILL